MLDTFYLSSFSPSFTFIYSVVCFELLQIVTWADEYRVWLAQAQAQMR